ncbi:MAG: O-antigen ligase family protein [Candidatus Omnitrophota bacterium]
MDNRKKEMMLQEERPLVELPILLGILSVLLFFGLGIGLLVFSAPIMVAFFLAGVVSISILLNPFIGAILFIAAAYLHPLQFMPGLKYSNFTTGVAFVIFLAWGFHVLVYRDLYIPKSKQWVWFFCFVLLAGMSSAMRWGESSFYYIDLLKVFVLYFLIAVLTKTKRHIFVLIAVLLFLGLMTAVLAIYQNIHGVGLRLSEGILRITGFSNDPNDLALSLLLLLPLTIGLFLKSRRFVSKAATLILLFLFLLVIALTFSRAVYLAVPIVFILSVWRFVRKNKRVLVILMIFLGIVPVLHFLPQRFFKRIETISMVNIDPSIWSRVDGYVVGLKMMAEHPFVGVGIGRWQREYWPLAIEMPLIRTKMSSVQHNIFIEVGSETGIMGLISFVLLTIYAFKDVRIASMIFEKSKDAFLSIFSKSLEIGLIGFLISTMFVAAIHVKFFWIILGFILALKGLALKIQSKELKIK